MNSSETGALSEEDTPSPPKIVRLSSAALNREEENKLRFELFHSKKECLRIEHEARMELIQLEKDAVLERMEIMRYEKEAAVAKMEYFRKKLDSLNQRIEPHSFNNGQSITGCQSYMQL